MYKLIISLLIIVSLVACNKEEIAEYSSDKSMTAKLDGNLWRATTPTGELASGFYVISGESKIGHTIKIYLSSVVEGEYLLSPNSNSYAEYIPADENDGLYITSGGEGTNGKVVITELNTSTNRATGTFYFKANKIGTNQTKTISGGEFTTIEYQSLAPSYSDNTMIATTNGSLWSGTTVTGALYNTINKIQLSGSDGLETISFTLPKDIIVGTYQFDGVDYNASYSLASEAYSTTNGSIAITDYNISTKRIRGSFNFNGKQVADTTVTIGVTSGQFNILYQEH